MTSAIGSSVVEDASFWEHQQQRDDHQEAAAAAAPAINNMPALPSLLRDTCSSKRILLQGTTACATVMSSLTMDLALSIASNEPCRCRISVGGGDGCCTHCVAVAILVPAFVAVAEEEPKFPLLCRPYSADNDDDMLLSSPQMSQSRQRNRFQPDSTQQQALHRIQVRRVAGLNDAMHYLLSLAGLPIEQQPVGGIIIDGLDLLVQQQQHMYHPTPHDAAAATTAIRMSQTVALLMDTVACLNRMHGRAPTVLVTLRDANEGDTTASITSNQLFHAASSFWSPAIMQLVPAISTTYENNQIVQCNDEVAVSHWTVKGFSASNEKETFATCTVLQNLDREQRIVWATTEK